MPATRARGHAVVHIIDWSTAVSLQTQYLAGSHKLPKATEIRKDHKVTCISVYAEEDIIGVADIDLSKRLIRQVSGHL